MTRLAPPTKPRESRAWRRAPRDDPGRSLPIPETEIPKPPRRRSRVGDWSESALEGLVALAVRRPRATLAAILLVTVVLGAGLVRLRFETGILDWLPQNHPNVQAFGRLLDRLEGITNQELIWVELDDEKAARAGVETIRDEDALRGQQELIDYVRARVPRIRHVFGLPHWVSLVNRLNHGNDPAYYRLPDSKAEIDVIWSALWAAGRELIEPTISTDARGAYLGLVIEGDPLTELARDVGADVVAAVDAYKHDASVRHDLFRHEFLEPVGLASGTALIDRSLRSDVVRLAPIAVALLAGALLLAFRRPRIVWIGIAALLLGIAWTYGLMGLTGSALNVVNVALVPLVFGCGIDFAIHVINEFAHGRSLGHSREAVLRAAARSSGVGIVLTTLTTVVGLFALTLADSPGMVELGAFAGFGMLSLALLSLTFVPAALCIRQERHDPIPFAESRRLGAVMEFFARHRLLALGLFLGLTAFFALLSGSPVYLLDVIQGNYRPDEPVARAVARMKEKAGGAFPEFIIFEGDVARPEALRAIEELEAAILKTPGASKGTRAASIADVLGFHEILKHGSFAAIPSFVAAKGRAADAAPQTRDGILAALREMDADPGWRPLASLFADPAGRMAVIILIVGSDAPRDDIESAGRLWNDLQSATAAETGGLRVSFLGYRTMAYLFISYSLFWLRVLFIVSFSLVLVLVGLFISDWRALLAVGALNLATGVWWLGLLHMRGIFISIFLLFPLVFTVCIGSDYGVHLTWRLSRGEDRLSVWRTTGKAVFFSALTDGAIFGLFATMRLVSASQVMESVVLAVGAVFAATLILVPALYGGRSRAPGR